MRQWTDTLDAIAAGMKRQALAYPGAVVRPVITPGKSPGEFPRGAIVFVKALSTPTESALMLWLRIARKGLSPENDFSPQSIRRARAWQTETQTFLRAFGAGPDVQVFQGAEGLYYFVDCYWSQDLRPENPAGATHGETPLQKTLVDPGGGLALARTLGE